MMVNHSSEDDTQQGENTDDSNNCWVQWRPTSSKKVEQAETKMLKGGKCAFERFFTKISDGNVINTVKVGNHDNNITPPLVLLHGYAAGLAFFISCFQSLSERRNVYAIDLLGFGRSSRPLFPTEHDLAENLFIDSIEEWRIKMELHKMILLGHSFGGYLAASYALKHSEHLEHLILADPWGFPVLPEEGIEAFAIPAWKLTIFKKLASYNPLSFLRAAGPLGPSLLRKIRGDIQMKYNHVFGEGDNTVTDYIYHCNAQDPSGETAFQTLSHFVGFSRNPLIKRIKDLHHDIPLTVLYGENTWMTTFFDFDSIEDELPNQCFFEMHQIDDAGHHIFSDNPNQFNNYVNLACNNTRVTCGTHQDTVNKGKSQFKVKCDVQRVTSV